MRKLSLTLACILLLSTIALHVGAAKKEQNLVLTVSEIKFSLVGDSENIAPGNIPAEEISWSSDAPEVVEVKDGILTAKAVGSATITASCDGKTVSCVASCLAEDWDSLANLPMTIRHSLKRVPPEVEFDASDYFSDAVFVGDSISYSLMVRELRTNALGHPMFLARKNVGVRNLLEYIVNPNYQGMDMPIEEAIAACGKKKVFFMLGMNDMGYQTAEETALRYEKLIDRIQKKNPDVEIIIQSCIPVYRDAPFDGYNDKIDQFNALVSEIAEEKNCKYLDLAAYIEDSGNAMVGDFMADYDGHMNEMGSDTWLAVLKAFAFIQ